MVASTRQTLTTTPAAIFPSTDLQPKRAIVRNRGAVAIHIGGANVTTANGFQLDAGESMPFDVDVNDEVWGVAASATAVIHILTFDGQNI